MATATAIDATRIVLLNASHLSPMGQSKRLRPAPDFHSDPGMG